LLANLNLIAATWRLIDETGGRGRWSHAISELAGELDAEPGATAVSLDWGFHEPLLFLTQRARSVEPIWAIPQLLRSGRPFVYEGDASTVYLVHDVPYDLFGLGPELLAAARGHRPERLTITAYRDKEGEPAFYSVRMPERHRLVYTGEFRFYGASASSRTTRPSRTSRSDTAAR